MSKKHSYYTDEFKAEAVKLIAQHGGNISQTATNLSIPMQTLNTWARTARQGYLKGDIQYNSEVVVLQEEIKQLKKALKNTETEREILKKATAYFARESQ